MDILNKAGSFQDPAGVYLSVPKSVGTSATQIKNINSRANVDVLDVQKAQVSKDIGAKSDLVKMRGAINSLNASVQNIQRGIEFSIDEESGRSIVKVVDRETGDVIRQLPAEDALEISRYIKEYVEARQTEGDTGGKSDDALGFIMQVQA